MTTERERSLGLLTATENLDYNHDWRRIHALFASLADHAGEYTAEERRTLITRCGDMLFSPYGAVRRQAGKTAAALLRHAGEDIVPLSDSLLHPCLFPDRALEESQARSLSYTLMQVVSLTAEGMTRTDRRTFLHNYVSYFKSSRWPDNTVINLISGLLQVPSADLTALEKHEIFGFIRQFLSGDKADIITLSLYLLDAWKTDGNILQDDAQRYLDAFDIPSSFTEEQTYLVDRVRSVSHTDLSDLSGKDLSDLMKRDLQLDYDWTSKLVCLDILEARRHTLSGSSQDREAYLDTYASHLENVLRLNDHPMVFLKAGEMLIALLPDLADGKRAEIFGELLKETEQIENASNYLPHFLARAYLLLSEDDRRTYAPAFRTLSDSHRLDTAQTVPDVICRIFRLSALEGSSLSEAGLFAGILSRALQDYRTELSGETDFLIRHYLLTLPAEKLDPTLVRALERNGLLERTANDIRPEKVAFFQATFDPFCLRDRAIIRELVDLDYHVCISISNFSPNKNPQPAHVRRRIATLSTADLEKVFLLPEEVTINTKTERGLAALRELFPESSVSLVLEYSDIDTSEDNAGNALPHIIYSDYDTQGFIDREAIRHVISGEVTFLQLPARYRGINSDEVKRKIKEHKDITGMVDVRIQSMIATWRLYYDRPMYRKKALTRHMERTLTGDTVSILVNGHTAALTWRNAGKTAVITDIEGEATEEADYRRLAIVEFLAMCQEKGFSHVVCFDAGRLGDLLIPYGFLPMTDYEDGLTLDMSGALVLFFDMISFLKEPYNTDPRVIRTIREGRSRLQKALTRLYPGKPVISFHDDIVNSQLIDLIRRKNESGRTLCVPFGKILRGIALPDMTVRELNTEKQYDSDLSGFEIREMPEYPSLAAQIGQLRSYDRPVMLVDDLYHKGYRLEKIREMMEAGGVDISSVITSVISDQGIELADRQGIWVDAIYRIRNMKVWLLESDLCPFIGGDGIEDDHNTHADTYAAALSSINTILPYQMPGFFRDAAPHTVYELSRVCLANTRELYLLLEDIYFEQVGQQLTFERIGQVMAEPRFPSSILTEPNKAKKVSELLAEEEKKLRRFRYL